ncbi:DNA-binding winged helix-turn-helix (wHTH) protein [Marinicella litoralis]|uniref:DNA-binding winged helix-turn-helix (WHTH) protein n=2 Tax=Marinicella litoralis TaxID=644220 RepID=A0A4R6XR31_9GAMM|nr:DNA-binding winged helix-turn-helix (wHTH) protein [Marinicella litoralis]
MIYSLNHVQFEVKNQQILVADKVIQLSPRGHQCLLLFLTSENQILSKDFLLKTLWENVIVSDDSLFKVIQETRKALRSTGLNEDVITNVYGKGYQLQAPVTAVSQQSFKPHVIGVLVLCLSVALMIALIKEPQAQVTDEVFKRQLAAIESNPQPQNLVFEGLTIDHHSHPSDQLKLAYLHGLERYKSGDYDRSIAHLMAGIDAYDKGASVPVLADTYLLLSKMYIYRSDKESLQYFLDQAEFHYRAMNDQTGITSTAISRARYHQSVYQFTESIVLLENILNQAKINKDAYNQMRAWGNLAYSYQQTHQDNKHVQALEQALRLALEIPDGDYAAYAYGALSQIYMEQADFVKAMKFAQQALKFVLEQQDTNNFQQGYSAFYNLLQELGHHELAQVHLQSAIEIQAQFNQESLLVLAEINLAKVNITLGDYDQANELLKKLQAVDLTTKEQLEVTALLALNSYYRQDNITAYTEAKRVFESTEVDTQVLLIAGTALALSSHQLERNDEAIKIFNSLQPITNPNWFFAHTQFLQLAEIVFTKITPDESERNKWVEAKTSYTQIRQEIKNQTQPDDDLINDLGVYLEQIMN